MARLLSTSHGTHRGAFAPADWARFAALSLIWGASFLLIAIGLDAFAPGVVTWGRVVSGAAVFLFVPGARAPVGREDRARVVAVAVVWVAVPFTLFPLAEQHVSSAVAGMLNGATPIVTAVVASLLLRRLPGRLQVAGLAVGFLGVVLIAVPAAGEGSSEAIGVLMLLVAASCYGVAINLVVPLQQRYGPMPVMARVLAIAAVLTAPFGLAGLPSSSFAWSSFLAVVVLGAVGTGFAFVLMGNLAGRVGGTRASFVTYLVPVVALVLGVAIRDEVVAAISIVGIGLVIGGAVLASRREV
ncbi:MAG TPA: DMT family transporter [Actinomycetota bacterium]